MPISVSVYRPGEWHDYFVMVGGAAAVLTGLVFVAMSLNVSVIAQDATHRARAIGTLTGITAVFVICALALMGGQSNVAVGLEWAAVATVAFVIYLFAYIQSVRLGNSGSSRRIRRVLIICGLYVAQLVGGVLLASGQIAGLYCAAVAMIAQLAFMITGAWLLIVGVQPSTETTDGR